MGIFKKKKPEEQPNYAEHKKAAEDTTVEHVDIGDGKSNDPEPLDLKELVIGMSDVEYKAQILSILLEIHDAVKPK